MPCSGISMRSTSIKTKQNNPAKAVLNIFCVIHNIFEKQRYISMATSVKIVPTLKGRTARRFAKVAEANMKSQKASIDFSYQVNIAQQILSKSSL